jgi:hypothetical protein
MSHSRQQYEAAFNKFVAANPAVWKRYETPAAAELLLAHLMQEQQPPSQITVELGIKALARQGLLVRVDGGTFETDTQQALQKITAQIDEPELTRSEVEYFQGLRDLEQLYWADGGYNRFAVRFNKAVKTRPYGLIFQIPGRPTAAVDGDGPALSLSAEEWRKIPASVSTRRYMQEPAFRRCTDKLIREGKI